MHVYIRVLKLHSGRSIAILYITIPFYVYVYILVVFWKFIYVSAQQCFPFFFVLCTIAQRTNHRAPTAPFQCKLFAQYLPNMLSHSRLYLAHTQHSKRTSVHIALSCILHPLIAPYCTLLHTPFVRTLHLRRNSSAPA